MAQRISLLAFIALMGYHGLDVHSDSRLGGTGFAFNCSSASPGFQEWRIESQMLELNMLSWALTFLVLALIAALFGFGGIAAGAASFAKVLFFLFLVLFVVSLIANVSRGRNVA